MSVKNANQVWVTPEVRTSFLNIYKARPNRLRQNALYYDFALMFPKTQAIILQAIVEKLSLEVFGSAIPPRPVYAGGPCTQPGNALKSLLKDGDAMAAHKECYSAYAGHWVMQLSSPADKPIRALDENREVVVDPNMFQSGDYCRAVIEISAYTSPIHGPQISVKPKVVAKTREGEHFAGGISAEEAEEALFNEIGTPPSTSGKFML